MTLTRAAKLALAVVPALVVSVHTFAQRAPSADQAWPQAAVADPTTLGPREAAGHLQAELEMSQRRAGPVVGQPRATQRHPPKPDLEEVRLRERLQEFSRQRPRAGSARPAGHCGRKGGASM